MKLFEKLVIDYRIKGVLMPKLYVVWCRVCNKTYFDYETDEQIERH